MTPGPRNRPEDDVDFGGGPVRAVQSAALRRALFADGGEPELSLTGALEFVDEAAVGGDALGPLLLVCALVASAGDEPPTALSGVETPVGPVTLGTPREEVAPAAVGAAVARERYALSLAEAAKLAGLRPEVVERAALLLERD